MATPYYNAGNTSGYPVVVVQGQNVSNVEYVGGNTPSYYNNHQSAQNVGTAVVGMDSSLLTTDASQSWTKGTPQPKQCRDVFWAILFYAHLVTIVCLAAIYTPRMANELANKGSSSSGQRRMAETLWKWSSIQFHDAPLHFHRFLQEQSTSTSTVSFNINAVLLVLGICGLLGLVMSSVALVLIMNFAAGLIKAALITHVVFVAALAVLALLAGSTGLCILLSVGAAVSLCFTIGAWSRIPFGAANLTTAVTAVRANIGLAFFAYLALVMSFLWSVAWSLAATSTVFVLNQCNSSFQCSNESPAGTFVLFLLLLSYHWTSQVIFNVVHVTTAGTCVKNCKYCM